MVIAQICVYTVELLSGICLLNMYCLVIWLHSMYCEDSFAGSPFLFGIVNMLVDTRG